MRAATLLILALACSSPPPTTSTPSATAPPASERENPAPTPADSGDTARGASAADHAPEHHGAEDREPAEGHAPGEPKHLGRRFVKADDYVGMFDDPKRDRWQRPAEVIGLMAIEPGMTAADIGAGTGYFLPHLSRAVGARGAVLALDIEPDMVRHMTERARTAKLTNVEARLVDPDDPKLARASVDRILVVNTWHHIGARKRYARRVAAALRPGGRVIIVDYPKDAPRGPPASHRLEPSTIVGELEAAGLRAEIATESLPYQYVIIGHSPR